MFDFFTRKAGCINIALGHSLLEATYEKLSKKEALLDHWDISWIQGFGDAHGIRVMAKLDGVTCQAKPLERPRGIRKDKTALEKLGQMMRPDCI